MEVACLTRLSLRKEVWAESTRRLKGHVLPHCKRCFNRVSFVVAFCWP